MDYNLPSSSITLVDTIIYSVFTEKITVKNRFYTFCENPIISEIIEANVTVPGGASQSLTAEELALHGIKLRQNNLEIFAEDVSLYDNIYEVTVKTDSEKEISWTNSTITKIVYTCLVTASDLIKIGGGVSISLNATAGQSKDV